MRRHVTCREHPERGARYIVCTHCGGVTPLALYYPDCPRCGKQLVPAGGRAFTGELACGPCGSELRGKASPLVPRDRFADLVDDAKAERDQRLWDHLERQRAAWGA